MGDKSAIEWTDATWNPVTGCTPISAGCDHCYAETLSIRLQRMGVSKYKNGFALTLHPEVLSQPMAWKSPRRVFVNSMSDLFHARVPFEFVSQVWEVMRECPQHTFQILTKRPERMARFAFDNPAPPNVWLGTSVEDERVIDRIDRLRRCRSDVRFLSCEPLIGPLDNLDLAGINWVIVGGESGPGHRPVRLEWVRNIRDQCIQSNVSFFFKQWGGQTPKAGGHVLDGRVWNQFPSVASEAIATGTQLSLYPRTFPFGDPALLPVG